MQHIPHLSRIIQGRAGTPQVPQPPRDAATNARSRFILGVTLSYMLLALGWIFLSDRLLAALADLNDMVWLSTAKGLLFVVASSALFYFSLYAVPPVLAERGETWMGAMAEGVASATRSRWLVYAFTLVASLAMLWVRQGMAGEITGRPMLILFMFPIILSALLGGLGPGLLSTTVVSLGVNLLAVPPIGSLSIAGSHDLIQWAFLVFNGVAVSLLSAMLHQTLSKAEMHRRLLDAVVSGSADAIYVKDRDGRYLLANAAAAALDARAGRAIHEATAFSPEDQRILAGGGTQTFEERYTTTDGLSRLFLVTKGPVLAKDGQVQGLFGICRDQSRAQQLARVIEGSDQGYWDWNLITNAFQVSARWETMLGYAPGEMDVTPEHWADHVHPDDLPLAMASVQRHIEGQSARHEVEIRCRTKSGEWRWILSRGRIVERSASGAPSMMSGTHTDISERKAFELALKEASTVFASSYEGIMVVSQDQRITKINPSFTRIMGYTAEEVVGQSPRVLASGRHGPAFYQAMWTALAERDFWRGEIWNQRKNGEVFAELLSISVVRDDAGGVQHYVAVFSDISQFKAHEAELDRIANYDPLTGAPNRRLLADRMSQAIARSTRSQRSVAVCMLDLDGFKAVNDQHGHEGGDQLLIGVTENLRHVLRSEDTLARLGGDEFVLLLSDIGSPEDCAQVLEKVLVAARSPVQVGGLSVSVTASLGVTLYPDDPGDADALLRHADQAMYLAKDAGRNRYHLFDPASDRKAQAHRSHLAQLRHALDTQQFELYYQPKVDLLSGAVTGAEALVRWNHPQRGVLAPGEFLPYLNGSSLEVPFGDWVIQTALAQAEAWSRTGLAVCVSANISAQHLLQPGFHDSLRTALARHPDAVGAGFELEVLETAAIADIDQAVAVLQRCRALGVHFALDDFGTGYSSLTYLRKLPVDTLKIDQSFVRNMLDDAEDMGIVEGVIRLAKAFNRQVIAEGVETLAHGAALVQLGCRHAQGYGIARPMPAAQFGDWAARWHSNAPWQSLIPSEAQAGAHLAITA